MYFAAIPTLLNSYVNSFKISKIHISTRTGKNIKFNGYSQSMDCDYEVFQYSSVERNN